MSASPPGHIGQRFGDIVVIGEVARGGQGVVLSGRQVSTGMPAAVKLLLDSNPSARRRFAQEARVLQRLVHPNLLRLLEYGEQAGVPYLAIEFVDGEDLYRLVKGRGIPRFAWTARVLLSIADALAHCHERGVVHRDLKPANMLVEHGSGRPVLVDFGLVKRDPTQLHLASLDAEGDLSLSGTIKGTPEYMAPEQANPEEFGEVGPHTDVYGLGATLYQLLTGEPPFRGGAAVIVMRKVTRKAPRDPRELNPQVPAPLAAFALRCLAKRPAERPAGMRGFAQELAAAAGIPPTPPTWRAAPPEQRRAPTEVAGAGRPGSDTALDTARLLPTRLPQPGEPFGGCQVVRKIAQGGGGAVFEALDAEGRPCALKVLFGDLNEPDKRERFLREGQVGRELNHPGVVQVFELGEDLGLAFLRMELLVGARPLDEYVRAEGLGLPARVQLVLQLAEAVEAAHATELIHRDLKPDNVLVTAEGQVKVLDFGLARHLDKERLTMSGVVMGTVAYMAPEQVRGQAAQADARTDVWAMGVMLHELVCGERPFQGGTGIELMAAILEDSPPDPTSTQDGPAALPPGLRDVIAMALAKDPSQRYESAAAFGRDLAAIYAGSSSTSAGTRARSRGRRRLLLRLAGAALLLSALAGVGVWLRARAGRLTPEELRAEVGSLNAEARELLSGPTGFFQEDAKRIAELGRRLEAALARADKGAAEVAGAARGAERVRALCGMARLAGGEPPGAAEEASTPAGEAWRAARRVAAGEGDAEAARALGRALARGLTRADLRAWRVAARLRAGIARAEADEVLDDLAQLERARGELLPTERLAGVWARLARDGGEAAAAALAGVADPPARVQWAVQLARARHALEHEPQRALAWLSGLPPDPGPSPARADLVELTRERALRLARETQLDVSAQARLVALCRLLRLLLPPGTAADAQLTEQLLAHMGYLSQTQDGDLELALAAAALRPEDPHVQTQVAHLVQRFRSRVNKLRILPVLRRAIDLCEDRGERLELRVLLCRELARICPGFPEDARACTDLADRLLEQTADPRQRSWLLASRAFALLELGRPGDAAGDLEEALPLNDEPIFRFWLARAQLELDHPERALELAEAFVLALLEGSHNGYLGLVLLWEEGRPRGELARIRRCVEHLLGVDPALPGWWVRLASLQLGAGEESAAAASLQRAAEEFSKKRETAQQSLAPRVAGLAEDLRRGAPDAPRRLGALLEELEELRAGGTTP